MQAKLLPLFPLQVVVFPRTQLPLHIFEERYKEMVGEAIRGKSEFGIVLAKEDGIVNAGCTVRVDKILKQYPDGRMDIVTSGLRRFEIVLLNQEKSFLRGEVEFFDDEDPAPAPDEVRQQALGWYKDLVEIGETRPFSGAVLTDPQLSFQLAQGIGDLDFLHTLLKNRSEAARLKQLNDFLSQYIPKLRRTTRMKRVAPFNGHGSRNQEI
jgi:Lon protease-like protein